jgi:REP element-mobilizing transposase RayT
MTIARYLVIPPGKDGFFHCRTRTVRQCALLGYDSYSKKNFDHRKEWVKQRLIFLASIFSIEVAGYACMINHLHVILKSSNGTVNAWSDEEVARRWLRLFPKKRDDNGDPLEPEACHLEAILGDPGQIATYRSRLNSISWFMKSLDEWISRKANREDGCTGKFWEGRFKCTALKTQGALLACMQYIDLNPIRTGTVETPENSNFTSGQDRIRAREARIALQRYRRNQDQSQKTREETPEQKEILRKLTVMAQRDSWLSPIKYSELETDNSFLNMKLDDYLSLLDWTGRNIVAGKKGSIPMDIEPLLQRMELNIENWTDTVEHFGSRFYHIAAPVKVLAAAASQLGLKWLKGKTGAKTAFS